MKIFIIIEEASQRHLEAGNLLVIGSNAVNQRHVMLRLGEHASGREAFAWRGLRYTGDVGLNHAEVAQGQTERELARLLHLVPGIALTRLYDHIAHAHLFDERHHLLPRTRADGKHGNHRRYTKIIPSMVSSERSLCISRFSSPKLRSAKYCPR